MGSEMCIRDSSKIEGGNYSVYICYIVAALVVFLVLAVVMV